MPDEHSFDDVRKEVIYNLEEDQYAGFIFVGVTDDGDVTSPIKATDGNRLPPNISRSQALGTMVGQVYNGIVDLSVGELIMEAVGADVKPSPNDDPFDQHVPNR